MAKPVEDSNMDTRQELLLGKLAVAAKMITKEQLKHCIDLQKQKESPLARIFLQQKLVNHHNLSVLLEKYFREIEETGMKEPGEDLVLCRLLLKNNHVSPAIVEEVFVQKRMTPKSSMGELLVKKHCVAAEKILDAYLTLEKETIGCPGCEKQFRLVRLSPGKKLRCKHCKTMFHVPTVEHEAGHHSSKRISLAETTRPESYGDYEVLEEIAEGGMGVIYRAQKKATGQVVALKVLREAHRSSHEAKERFKREAWLLKQKLSKHKNIVAVYDVGIADDVPYFAMEFITGKPLSEVIEGEVLSIDKTVTILIKLCDGMHYAHSEGIVHRDLKPSNILLNSQEEPQITDFGLAKCVDSMTLVTRTGAMLGTPYYMSPEQAKGQLGLVGPRSDIYSLGVIFYEMLTGRKPFIGETAVEIYQNILTTPPVPPSKVNHKIPKQLDKICMRCLEKNPFHRYKTAEEFAGDLRLFQKKKVGLWSRIKQKMRRK